MTREDGGWAIVRFEFAVEKLLDAINNVPRASKSIITTLERCYALLKENTGCETCGRFVPKDLIFYCEETGISCCDYCSNDPKDASTKVSVDEVLRQGIEITNLWDEVHALSEKTAWIAGYGREKFNEFREDLGELDGRLSKLEYDK